MSSRRCLCCGTPVVPNRSVRTPGTRRHIARGLCSTCYDRERVAGRLHQWPPTKVRCVDGGCDFCADVAWLADTGAPAHEWADRLDTTVNALSKRLYRHGQTELANRVERVRRQQRTLREAS